MKNCPISPVCTLRKPQSQRVFLHRWCSWELALSRRQSFPLGNLLPQNPPFQSRLRALSASTAGCVCFVPFWWIFSPEIVLKKCPWLV
ncbi:hypothetical protein K470DRAFT_122528 [Piedraia hortae CBS 480.64]|uniref:Uncharacterized protein n=1 Tax=Piedraia hortae CBS 480.64 TaxID=1314780 RepID=A0A6A7C8K1_9PEZI|nr:hypothetical protein K470DRAFT_122528 [Piedraia hortae CBS 480.64]